MLNGSAMFILPSINTVDDAMWLHQRRGMCRF